jgi:hypothetical protein
VINSTIVIETERFLDYVHLPILKKHNVSKAGSGFFFRIRWNKVVSLPCSGSRDETVPIPEDEGRIGLRNVVFF